MKKFVWLIGLLALSIGARDVACGFKDDDIENLALYRQLYKGDVPWDVFLARQIIQEYLEAAQLLMDPEDLKMEQEAIRLRDPYGSYRAKVRQGTDISVEERASLRERFIRVKKGIKRFLRLDKPLEDDEVPRIALCGSGGGIRAALCTLGSLLGAAETGLLDCTLYASALSGSAWLMGSIFSDSYPGDGVSVLQDYKSRLKGQLKTGLSVSLNPLSVKLATENLMTKFYYGQSLSLVDFWGFIVGEVMLRNLGQYWQKAVLSSQGMLMETGIYPFPLYSSIMPMGNGKFEWFEVSPYEVWSEFLQMAIPTWSFGRKFQNGLSQDFAPEQSLGFYLGIFGSAFELDLTDFMHHMGRFVKDPVLKGLVKILMKTSMKDMRLSPAELYNYSYGMRESILTGQKRITLIDAGIDFNLPIPPLLRKGRDIDVIIILDSSAKIEGRELRSITRYATERGIPIPTIDADSSHENIISVYDDNVDAPILVYLPRLKNDNYSADFDPGDCASGDFCHTFNFEYNEEQVDLLTGLTESNMKESIPVIQNVIKEAIRRRRAKLASQEGIKK
ncbi:hypothetical protein HOM50_03915 [bacterium]|jgi:hypothetical protein|nr:hypothetical protein [bacterium]MBT5015525.1 hypothetical protein [bacterium]